MTMPVSLSMIWLPKGRFTVVVREMVRPDLSAETIWDVPTLQARLLLRTFGEHSIQKKKKEYCKLKRKGITYDSGVHL